MLTSEKIDILPKLKLSAARYGECARYRIQASKDAANQQRAVSSELIENNPLNHRSFYNQIGEESYMITIHPDTYKCIVFFTGAGMSAESGVPTYRGRGGVWSQYNWEEYACQEAFDGDAEKVLKFHQLRRQSVLTCTPHAGHYSIAELEKKHPQVIVVTQNIDGMHQRAGSKKVIELHGSLWRVRCPSHGIFEDIGKTYKRFKCEQCGSWLRPDITWFGDMLNQDVISEATVAIRQCDLFISIGTSGVVWPAAGFPKVARESGACCIEINPEPNEMSPLYNETVRETAGVALPRLFA
jgi:NAD-dependent deacetylase